MGHYDSTLAKLKQLNSGASDKASLLAEVYVHRLAGRHEDELRVITGSLSESVLTQQHPAEYVQALRSNQLAVTTDGVNLTPGTHANIHVEPIRLSFMFARSESERYAIADRVLVQYATLEILWHDNPGHTAQYQCIRVDHLGALLTRDHYKDAISHYRRLKNMRQVALPRAQYWVTSAYLKEQQPEKAQSMMTEFFYHKETIAPDLSDEGLADLFYSHLESENHSGVLVVTRHTINTSPLFLQLMDAPASAPNGTWLQGHSFLSTAAKCSNDLPQVEIIARESAYNAPEDQGLCIDYVSVLQTCDWHRAVESELKKAEATESCNISLEVGQTWTVLTLQGWQQTAVLTYDIVEREPQGPGAVRLEHVVDIHDPAELRITSSTGIDVEDLDSGKHDADSTIIAYPSPLRDNWRGFAEFGYTGG